MGSPCRLTRGGNREKSPANGPDLKELIGNAGRVGSAVGGGEVGISLHAVLTDVETFDLFFFGDADATEGADHRPGDEAGDESPDGVASRPG